MNRIKITASEGMILTNGESFGKEIYLSIFDDPNNWREISAEEYEDIIREEGYEQ